MSTKLALVISAMFTVLNITATSNAAAAASRANDGAADYQAYCSGCHAADASGNSPAAKQLKVRDLRSPEVQKKTDAELTRIIAKGTKNMPGYEKNLGPKKIRDLVLYLRQLGRKK